MENVDGLLLEACVQFPETAKPAPTKIKSQNEFWAQSFTHITSIEPNEGIMLCSHLLITEDITLHMSFFFSPSLKKLMQTASIFSNVCNFSPALNCF